MKQSTVINCDEFLPACLVYNWLVGILFTPAVGIESLAVMRFQHGHHRHVTL